MVRVDINKKWEFIDRDGLRTDQIPSIFIYFEGDYFLYEGNKQTIEELLHFVNKLINPMITLSTDDDI